MDTDNEVKIEDLMDSDPDIEFIEKDSGMSSLGGSKDETPERRTVAVVSTSPCASICTCVSVHVRFLRLSCSRNCWRSTPYTTRTNTCLSSHSNYIYRFIYAWNLCISLQAGTDGQSDNYDDVSVRMFYVCKHKPKN